ncbi:ROK family transcriptional regulator [Glycomyces tenuis]|uniref:ROK family transcriptional regulator n=1 Tax=Glycomyces tenuis TaxID=58116 RepID=UPI00041B8010|nr:ROK family transcriptional regulator [Glycomyces tenuis]
MPQPGPGRGTTAGRMLDLLRANGTLSRVELAERTGLTPATVTHTVRRLIGAGLVDEIGPGRRRGRGQPRRLLELNADAWYAVGIQVDRTTTTIVVLDFAGERIAGVGLRGSGSGGPEATVAALAEHVSELLRGSGVPVERVLGAGLVTHGPQDRERGVLLTAQPAPEWLEFPLTDALAERLGVPVLLENDATAAAFGEQWAGALPTDTFGLVYMASGVGGAVVVDGENYRGRASNAVEIGHVALNGGNASCVCGNRGCAQAEAGPHAVVERALADDGLAARLGVRGTPDHTLGDFERIAKAWRSGDADAEAILECSARWIGRAAVTLVNLFDLDTVVLAGPAFATAGELYRARIAAELEERALSRALSRPQVRLSASTETAAALGGALHVLRAMPIDPEPPAATPEGAQ